MLSRSEHVFPRLWRSLTAILSIGAKKQGHHQGFRWIQTWTSSYLTVMKLNHGRALLVRDVYWTWGIFFDPWLLIVKAWVIVTSWWMVIITSWRILWPRNTFKRALAVAPADLIIELKFPRTVAKIQSRRRTDKVVYMVFISRRLLWVPLFLERIMRPLTDWYSAFSSSSSLIVSCSLFPSGLDSCSLDLRWRIVW